jgi:hypothetical protein
MLPYPHIEDIDISLDSFSQELKLNVSTAKLLENDKCVFDLTDVIKNSDFKNLRLADSADVLRLKADKKAISPASSMAISATPQCIKYNRPDRFITNTVYGKLINSYNPKTVFIDLSFDNIFVSKAFPSDHDILNKVIAKLNGYEPAEGTILYARFIWTRSWMKKKRKTWGIHKSHYYYWIDYLYQDTYKRENNRWVLKRRRQSNRI